MVKMLFYIGIGGFLGSVARYGVANFLQNRFFSNWPFGTFAVNLIGCFAIGALYVLAERTVMSPEWRLFLATGLCGGFTTFSAFSLEIVTLLRAGQWHYAATYTAFSLILGLAGVWAGLAVTRLVV